MWACAEGQPGFRRRSATRFIMGCRKPWVETHGFIHIVADTMAGTLFRSVRANELRMLRSKRHSIRPPFSRTVWKTVPAVPFGCNPTKDVDKDVGWYVDGPLALKSAKSFSGIHCQFVTTQVAQIAYVQQILFTTKNTKSTKGVEKQSPG